MAARRKIEAHVTRRCNERSGTRRCILLGQSGERRSCRDVVSDFAPRVYIARLPHAAPRVISACRRTLPALAVKLTPEINSLTRRLNARRSIGLRLKTNDLSHLSSLTASAAVLHRALGYRSPRFPSMLLLRSDSALSGWSGSYTAERASMEFCTMLAKAGTFAVPIRLWGGDLNLDADGLV
jgi:hypothetical protein